MTLNEQETARVLDAALTLCIHQGNATAAEVIAATNFESGAVIAALNACVLRGNLTALPGGFFKPRRLRMPGVGFGGEIHAPVTRMMGARA